jgi:hypothetical protein
MGHRQLLKVRDIKYFHQPKGKVQNNTGIKDQSLPQKFTETNDGSLLVLSSHSTMSSSLNAIGAVLFEDFIRPCLRNKINDKTANNIIKFVVVIIGALCVLIVFVVDKLGAVLQVRKTLKI